MAKPHSKKFYNDGRNTLVLLVPEGRRGELDANYMKNKQMRLSNVNRIGSNSRIATACL